MEDNSENTDIDSTPIYEKIERLIDSRMNQIEVLGYGKEDGEQ